MEDLCVVGGLVRGSAVCVAGRRVGGRKRCVGTVVERRPCVWCRNGLAGGIRCGRKTGIGSAWKWTEGKLPSASLACCVVRPNAYCAHYFPLVSSMGRYRA